MTAATPRPRQHQPLVRSRPRRAEEPDAENGLSTETPSVAAHLPGLDPLSLLLGELTQGMKTMMLQGQETRADIKRLTGDVGAVSNNVLNLTANVVGIKDSFDRRLVL